jgi:nicotinamide mononucleotide transporter
LLGLTQIVLLVRRSVWNFPTAMAQVALTGVVLTGARLYSEAGLQAFFFVVNIHGWYLWNHAQGDDADVPVKWMEWPARAAWSAVTVALSLALGWIMHLFTNAALPFADSAVTGASVAAQLLLNMRRIENWVLWIAIDLASVGLYITRGLNLLAALYVAFLVLSAIGLQQWRRAAP